MCRYEKASVVKGHHIYKAVWTPVIGEGLHTQLEENNKHNEYTVVVILDGRTVGHLPGTVSLVSWFFLRLPPRLEALFQQCKTSAYELPLHLCGHVECLPHPPYGYPACIGDLAFVNVKLCGHPACIGGPACIRGRRLREEMRYLYA